MLDICRATFNATQFPFWKKSIDDPLSNNRLPELKLNFFKDTDDRCQKKSTGC